MIPSWLSILKFYFKLENKYIPNLFRSFPPKPVSHKYGLRYKSMQMPELNKDYTRACLRYSLSKIFNSTQKPTSTIDSETFETSFKHDKLGTLSSDIIGSILNKVTTHSLNGYSKYIKIAFISRYWMSWKGPHKLWFISLIEVYFPVLLYNNRYPRVVMSKFEYLRWPSPQRR